MAALIPCLITLNATLPELPSPKFAAVTAQFQFWRLPSAARSEDGFSMSSFLSHRDCFRDHCRLSRVVPRQCDHKPAEPAARSACALAPRSLQRLGELGLPTPPRVSTRRAENERAWAEGDRSGEGEREGREGGTREGGRGRRGGERVRRGERQDDVIVVVTALVSFERMSSSEAGMQGLG
eukprot:3675058-Rhodomonas_salina.1